MPELLVAAGVMAILVVISVTLVHPTDFGPSSRDAKRTTDTAQLLQALNKYVADTGEMPEGITNEPQILGSEDAMLNLCNDLVPKYLKDLPLDPLAGGTVNKKVCDPDDPLYTTGYTIHLSKKNEVVIEAPIAEEHQKISQTRKY
jgi:hypothetical protein